MMKMKRSASSSSSSSCIVSGNEIGLLPKPIPSPSEPVPKRVRTKRNRILSADSPTGGPAMRSSIYRGVTRHRWSGRFEAHLWDRTIWNSTLNKKGRQSAYDSEEDAARTYDLAALKYWGPGTTLNFPIETYAKELEEMQNMSKEEFLASLRRKSSGFSRGVSKYRGVARHHHNGRWEARIGRVSGNKYLYLGTFSTQEEAAVAYDIAAIEQKGANAVTNFDISNYADKLKEIREQNQIKQHSPSSKLDNERPGEVQEQEQEQQGDQCLVQQETMPKLESSMVVGPRMDHQEEAGFWDFCTDSGFDSFSISDLLMEEEEEEDKEGRASSYLLDFFNDSSSSQNNLDFLF
ncbi:unnamed protein product [Cuscuta campestris]|uniref:AP2/ERF domain-containing protein n=1 Tax=Cuscuta campestris TaxID=132261 RepID=A0A484KSM5_9ASTE|nr:unnamed protein product [Cuscuta campestris]